MADSDRLDRLTAASSHYEEEFLTARRELELRAEELRREGIHGRAGSLHLAIGIWEHAQYLQNGEVANFAFEMFEALRGGGTVHGFLGKQDNKYLDQIGFEEVLESVFGQTEGNSVFFYGEIEAGETVSRKEIVDYPDPREETQRFWQDTDQKFGEIRDSHLSVLELFGDDRLFVTKNGVKYIPLNNLMALFVRSDGRTPHPMTARSWYEDIIDPDFRNYRLNLGIEEDYIVAEPGPIRPISLTEADAELFVAYTFENVQSFSGGKIKPIANDQEIKDWPVIQKKKR